MIKSVISKTDIHVFLIALAIVLTPFDGIAGLAILGGLSHTASMYPIMIGMLIWVIGCKGRVRVPNVITYKLLMLFYFFAILSVVANYNDIRIYHFQGQVGFSRAIVQLGSLGMTLLIPLYLYNVLYHYKKNKYEFFYKYLIYSFLLAGLYSALEILTFLDVGYVRECKLIIDDFIRTSGEGEYGLRLRSVSAEASTFGAYLVAIIPWMIYKAGKSKIYTCLLLYLVLLCLLSLSRTAYVVLTLQFILCFILYGGEYRRFIIKIVTVILLLSGVLYSQASDYFGEKSFDVVLTSVVESDGTMFDKSNIARYASQEAALKMFEYSPVYGIGYGMYGFLAPDYYPQYAWESSEIVSRSINFNTSETWPPVHSWIMRILGETGLLGLVTWLLVSLSVGYYMYGLQKKSHSDVDKMYVISGIISFIGCSVMEFKGDSLYNLSLWVLMCLPFISMDKRARIEDSNWG